VVKAQGTGSPAIARKTEDTKRMKILKKLISTLSLVTLLTLAIPAVTLADERGREQGDDVSIVLDLLVLRPVGVVTTAAGILVFVGSLPISLSTLSVDKAFNALVVTPAHYTFVRKLGEEHHIPQ
jgi:hypothetical protein